MPCWIGEGTSEEERGLVPGFEYLTVTETSLGAMAAMWDRCVAEFGRFGCIEGGVGFVVLKNPGLSRVAANAKRGRSSPNTQNLPTNCGSTKL